MSKLRLVGERLVLGVAESREAFIQKDEESILDITKKQIDAGVSYLNISVGSFPEDAAIMSWVVKLVQKNFDNIPLVLNSENKTVIEAGLKVYNRSKGKPVVNSADAGRRSGFLNLAAEYDAKCICVCMKNEVPLTEKERVNYCTQMLSNGLSLGINPNDMYFDAVAVPLLEEQERIPDILDAIAQIKKLKLRPIIGVTNISVGLPELIKPVVESAFATMAMGRGLYAAIVNPLSPILMTNIYAAENILNERLYSNTEFSEVFKGMESYVKNL